MRATVHSCSISQFKELKYNDYKMGKISSNLLVDGQRKSSKNRSCIVLYLGYP